MREDVQGERKDGSSQSMKLSTKRIKKKGLLAVS